VLRVRALEKGITLDCRWLSGVPETILTDPARFRQLLMNLVSNAIKFTKKGGVKILARLVSDPANPRLVIQVTDTGIGIPAEKFEAIFDPFVQADSSVTRQFGGTGLGLTICRRITQALGGDIEITSEVGKGSTFTVSIATGPMDGVAILDAPASDALQIASEPTQEALPSLEGVRVLLVEDGESNRKLISLVLRDVGADVTTAENGQVGVDLAMRTPIDLILMDMQMPVMDGYAAATLLRQRGVTVPIFALTAHAMMGDEEKCRAAGCSGYVTKPVDTDLLIRAIAKTLGISGVPQEQGVADRPSSNEAAHTSASGVPASPAWNHTGSRCPALYSTLPTHNPDYREIVEEFIPRLQEQIAAIQRAYEGRDMAELGRLAHWLKGAAGTVGFPAFTHPAKQLLARVKEHQYDELEIIVAEILEMGQRVAIRPAESDKVRS
jgi:CheY-like chemotaxis protein/HPt (histidine-containing phosphotransfer) domain-containing protein